MPTQEKKKLPTVETQFGEQLEQVEEQAPVTKAASKGSRVQTFKPYHEQLREDNEDMCTVVHGFGRVSPNHKHYIDNYLFIGGVCHNVPRNVATAWAKGRRWQDDKPAVSRVYLQAILPNDATEADIVAATGIQQMPASELAAMIGASDARALVDAMGEQAALEFADRLRKQIGNR